MRQQQLAGEHCYMRQYALCKRSVADRARQGARSQSRPVMQSASSAPRATVGSKIDEATTARWGTLLHAAIRSLQALGRGPSATRGALAIPTSYAIGLLRSPGDSREQNR